MYSFRIFNLYHWLVTRIHSSPGHLLCHMYVVFHQHMWKFLSLIFQFLLFSEQFTSCHCRYFWSSVPEKPQEFAVGKKYRSIEFIFPKCTKLCTTLYQNSNSKFYDLIWKRVCWVWACLLFIMCALQRGLCSISCLIIHSW